MPKISRYFVAYLSGLILVAPNIGGTSDTRAASLGEVHTDVVLKVLKLETDAPAAYSDFLDRKLVEWYAAAPKSDSHAPVHEDNDEKVSEAGRGGCGPSVRDALNGLINHCNLISTPKRTDRRRGRGAAAFDLIWGAFEQDRGHFWNGQGRREETYEIT